MENYGEGDLFSCPTEGNAGSKLLINKIEEIASGINVYHITLYDAVIYADGRFTALAHLPVSKEVLECSLGEKISENNSDKSWLEGYKLWKKDNGGVFSTSVNEIVDFIKQCVPQDGEEKV